MMGINWETALFTAFVTTVGTIFVAYISHVLSLKREAIADTRTRERHAVYLAIRLIGVLDEFVRGCLEIVEDNGQYLTEHHGQQELNPTASYPTLALPQDVDWKTITTEFMYRALEMPLKIDAARRSILLIADISGPPDYDEVFEQRQFEFSRLGLSALDLAEDLRNHYKIPAKAPEVWSPKEEFEKKIKALSLKRKEEDEINHKRHSAAMLLILGQGAPHQK